MMTVYPCLSRVRVREDGKRAFNDSCIRDIREQQCTEFDAVFSNRMRHRCRLVGRHSDSVSRNSFLQVVLIPPLHLPQSSDSSLLHRPPTGPPGALPNSTLLFGVILTLIDSFNSSWEAKTDQEVDPSTSPHRGLHASNTRSVSVGTWPHRGNKQHAQIARVHHFASG
jgi:hypothetical protein